ncbi:MAG: DUF4238 domain-containing protein [Clostridia bacterium]|nr:DUF4238 domain-containing protein [Clostridia bacterium]
MDQVTRSQHTVPRFYLKNFSEKGRVWALDKKDGHCFNPSIDDICVENYFYEMTDFDGNRIYENAIENKFQQQEAIWALLLQRIIRICDTISNGSSFVASTEEKSMLLDMTINILMRNPVSLQSVSSSLEKGGMYEFIDDQQKAVIPDLQIEQLQNFHESFNRFILYSDERAARERKEHFGKYYFYVGFAKGRLITASMPIYLSRKLDGDKLILPISPDYALIWTENKLGKMANVLLPMSDEIIADLRRCYFEKRFKDCRFVIADRKDKIICA